LKYFKAASPTPPFPFNDGKSMSLFCKRQSKFQFCPATDKGKSSLGWVTPAPALF